MKISLINNYPNRNKAFKANSNKIVRKTVDYNLKSDCISFTSKSIALPKQELINLISESKNKIFQTHDISEKEAITQLTKNALLDILFKVKPFKQRKEYENSLFLEFGHDISNIWDFSAENSKMFNNKFNIAKSIFTETLDYYQLMFNSKGLEDKNYKQVFNFSLNMLKNKAKRANVKLEISNSNVLKEKFAIPLSNIRIYSVFHNIIDNSIKYSKDGTVKISFEKTKKLIENPESYRYMFQSGKMIKVYIPNISREKIEKNGINFIVEDQGIGIKSEDFKKVLNGNRGVNAVEQGYSGTGFGLKKVNKLLNFNHISEDGNIIIESPISNDIQKPGTRIICFLCTK